MKNNYIYHLPCLSTDPIFQTNKSQNNVNSCKKFLTKCLKAFTDHQIPLHPHHLAAQKQTVDVVSKQLGIASSLGCQTRKFVRPDLVSKTCLRKKKPQTKTCHIDGEHLHNYVF